MDSDRPAEIADEARRQMDEVAREFEERLSRLESRSQVARRRHEQRKERLAEARARDKESYRGLGLGMTIAYAIIGAPLAGFFVGWGLDALMGGGTLARAFLTLAGAVAGVTFAVVVLNRHAS